MSNNPRAFLLTEQEQNHINNLVKSYDKDFASSVLERIIRSRGALYLIPSAYKEYTHFYKEINNFSKRYYCGSICFNYKWHYMSNHKKCGWKHEQEDAYNYLNNPHLNINKPEWFSIELLPEEEQFIHDNIKYGIKRLTDAFNKEFLTSLSVHGMSYICYHLLNYPIEDLYYRLKTGRAVIVVPHESVECKQLKLSADAYGCVWRDEYIAYKADIGYVEGAINKILHIDGDVSNDNISNLCITGLNQARTVRSYISKNPYASTNLVRAKAAYIALEKEVEIQKEKLIHE